MSSSNYLIKVLQTSKVQMNRSPRSKNNMPKMVQVVSPQNKLQPSSIQLIPIPDLNLKRSMPQDGTGQIWPYFDLIWPHLKIGRRGSNSSKSDDNRAVLLTVDNKDQEGKVLPQSCFFKKIFCIELFFGMGFTVKTQLGGYLKIEK